VLLTTLASSVVANVAMCLSLELLKSLLQSGFSVSSESSMTASFISWSIPASTYTEKDLKRRSKRTTEVFEFAGKGFSQGGVVEPEKNDRDV